MPALLDKYNAAFHHNSEEKYVAILFCNSYEIDLLGLILFCGFQKC